MIKTFVKHCIYDFCIDIFFNRVSRNFKNSRSNKLPKAGEFYSRVVHKYDDETYHNCIVTGLEERTNNSNENYYIITIKYEYCNGSIFDDDAKMEEEINANLGGFVYDEDLDEEEIEMLNDEDAEKNHKDWMDDDKIDAAEFGSGLNLNYNFFDFYR